MVFSHKSVGRHILPASTLIQYVERQSMITMTWLKIWLSMCAGRICELLELCHMKYSIHLTIVLFAQIFRSTSRNISVPSNDIRMGIVLDC